MKLHFSQKKAGFTLIELLIVIGIIAILAGLSMPVYSKITERARMINQIANVKSMTMHTLRWASDNSQTLPSPEYPGGHGADEGAIPAEWDYTGAGTGLWLDGVVYHAALSEDGAIGGEQITIDTTNGAHLKDTIFFALQSFKKDPTESNIYLHSYAMNKSLQHDFLFEGTSSPELTGKNLAQITHRPSALLYIENQESNIIGFEDIEAILETGNNRWSSDKVIASFLDGSCRTLSRLDIPAGGLNNDRASSRFWRGVNPSE